MAIVMVHGYPATSHLWDPVIDALGEVGEPLALKIRPHILQKYW